MSYKIDLAEYQRELIVRAMELALLNSNFVRDLGINKSDHGPGDTMAEEFDILLGMMKSLPQDEKENPDCLHGFAL